MPFGLSLLRTTDIPLEMNMTQRNEGPAPQSYTLCLAAASFSSDVFWWGVRENGSSGSELNLCNFFPLFSTAFFSLERSFKSRLECCLWPLAQSWATKLNTTISTFPKEVGLKNEQINTPLRLFVWWYRFVFHSIMIGLHWALEPHSSLWG